MIIPPTPQPPSVEDAPVLRLVETKLILGPKAPSGPVATSPKAVASIAHAVIGTSDREEMLALYVNAKHMVTHLSVVSRGSLAAVDVHPREVWKAAFLANAQAVILAHNHPSGDPRPSSEDRRVAARMREVGELLGVEMLDFLIVAPRGAYYSASDDGLFQLSASELMEAP